jgi:hypothetical protein
VPETTRAERRAAGREADRRRQAADELRLAASVCQYGAAQLGNGLEPGQARLVALELAGELEAVAEAVRRLTRVAAGERRVLARQLAQLGWTTGQIARQLGVCDRAARNYVVGRRSDGKPWAQGLGARPDAGPEGCLTSSQGAWSRRLARLQAAPAGVASTVLGPGTTRPKEAHRPWPATISSMLRPGWSAPTRPG